MATAAPSRFQNYNLPKPSSLEKSSQSMGPPFGKTPWGSNDSIWSNRNVIGGVFSSQRENSGSRDSDDVSPAAQSGSAQLTHQSEAEPWGPSRTGFWNTQEASAPGRSSSGNTSPNQTRDSGSSQHGVQEAQYFQARNSVGQSGGTFVKRTNGHGGRDASSNPFNHPVFGSTVDEDMDGNAQYAGLASKHPFDTYKRNSQGQPFASLGQGRDSMSMQTSRQSDVGLQTTPGPLHPELSQYPFDSPISGTSRVPTRRPSVPHHSVSFPSNSNAGRNIPGSDRDLSGLFADSLRLEELDNGTSGLTNDGFPNPASQPFQFNPSSQAWQNESASGARGFSQFSQNEVYSEQAQGPYFGAKRGSVDRQSPASSTFHRSSLNSPRFTQTPNSRSDSWSHARPVSRNHSLLQDVDRPGLPFSTAPALYANNAYYSNNLAAQFAPQLTPYEIYGQNLGFRNQVQLPPYNISQFMPPVNIPVRPSRDHDVGRGVRSMLLEDFRASNRSNKRWELKDIYGHVVEFSGDQHGSRFIQEKIQSANSDEKDQVFREVEPNAVQLMKDVFGNYVIQKFFEHGSQVQKKILAAQMKGMIAELSMQMYACRVVQKALEHVLVEQQEEIVDELKNSITKVVKDQNGNHVIQKTISLVPRMCIPFMMTAFHGQIYDLSVHNYGCRVIQRMLEKGTESEKRVLLEEIHSCAQRLITDQYGNYVAQHVVQYGDGEDRSRMVGLVIDGLLNFSKHKFASNVVERCVEFGTEEERMEIKLKLTTELPDGTSPLQTTMKDPYGNYVVQRLLQQLKGDEKLGFVAEMKPQFASLKKNVSGRQITAIERLVAVANEPNENDGANATANIINSGLQIDVSSAVPTPALTMEHNSPESYSPPSTNLSAADESVGDSEKTGVHNAIVQPQVLEGDEV